MTINEKRTAVTFFCKEHGAPYRECDCVHDKDSDFYCHQYTSMNASPEIIEKWYSAIYGNGGNAVNHPSHYQGKHECIDEMIALFGVDAVIGFCKCNVHKYRYRAKAKNGQEDLDKADWYMDKLMELEAMKND